LREAGAEVILTGTNAQDVEARNRAAESAGQRGLRYWPVDLGDRESLDAFIARVDALDRIDICVNNAGINRLNPIEEIVTDDLDAMLEVNLRSPFVICRTVSRKMKDGGYGRIVNVASIWSVKTKAQRSLYSATKSGLVGMTKTLAVELAEFRVLVNAVSPGFVMTEMTAANLSASERDALAAQVPARRFAQPEEIAKVVLFLASEENSYITGQNIVADGGFVCV